MNTAAISITGRASELRQAFDRSFADLPSVDSVASVDLLAIRSAQKPFALRLSEIAGLFTGKKITRVPGGSGGVLGIVGFRGVIVPVYDLQNWLGQTSLGQTSLGDGRYDMPRWVAMAAAMPIAITFETFELQLRVPADAILPQQVLPETRHCIRDFVQTGDVIRPIIHLPSLLAAITS